MPLSTTEVFAVFGIKNATNRWEIPADLPVTRAVMDALVERLCDALDDEEYQRGFTDGQAAALKELGLEE